MVLSRVYVCVCVLCSREVLHLVHPYSLFPRLLRIYMGGRGPLQTLQIPSCCFPSNCRYEQLLYMDDLVPKLIIQRGVIHQTVFHKCLLGGGQQMILWTGSQSAKTMIEQSAGFFPSVSLYDYSISGCGYSRVTRLHEEDEIGYRFDYIYNGWKSSCVIRWCVPTLLGLQRNKSSKKNLCSRRFFFLRWPTGHGKIRT